MDGSYGAVVAPVITVNTTTITKESLFSDSNYHPAGSIDTSVDPEGFDRRHESATAWLKKSETVQTDRGGGTVITDNSYVFDTVNRQRVTQTDNSFHFEATTAVNTVLDSLVSISQHGNFFFIRDAPFSSVIDLRRTVRFTVDQPMRLQVQFSGQSTNSGANFKNMFNILALSGGNFGIADRVFMFTSTNYQATETTTFSGGGSREGVDYQLRGEANGNSIDLTIDLSPSIGGTAPILEFRWTLPHTLNGGVAASAFGWDRVVSSAALVNESVSIVAIPELATVGYAAFAISFGCMFRRRFRP